jgi:anti-sigma regulatory factor (Ser/Thr protein kinase)
VTTLVRPSRRGPSWRAARYEGVRLRHDPAELARVRGFAETAARRFGLGPTAREEFKLAASEAVSNAIEHGLPCRDGSIHVWIAERDRSLTLAVRNRGEFVFKPPPSDPLAERGRGLTLMADLVDTVALSRIGSDVIQIELTKERPGEDS